MLLLLFTCTTDDDQETQTSATNCLHNHVQWCRQLPKVKRIMCMIVSSSRDQVMLMWKNMLAKKRDKKNKDGNDNDAGALHHMNKLNLH